MKYCIVYCFLLSVVLVDAQNPNILFVIADDMGTDVTNGYFNNTISANTPTLDSLRSIGVTFDNVWAYPSCTPTRSSIMSGKFGVKTGVLRAPGNLDLSHTSLFERMKQYSPSYSGAVVGKWHISHPVDLQHPYLHDVDYYMGYMDASPASYYAWDKTSYGVTTTETGYVTSVLTDSAIHWINNQSNEWLMWLAHGTPHTPFHLPPAGTYSINGTNTNYRKFIAMIESLDFEVNRLINSLDPVTRANTLVVFIGDNGTSNQVLKHYPAGKGKSSLYQGGIRVPMIVAGKGVTRFGQRENALIHVLDIHATILEVMGKDLPGGIEHSLSFKHLLSGGMGDTRDYVYTEYDKSPVQGHAIRNDRYKLIKYDNGTEEMYDLVNDPFELINLLSGVLTSQEQVSKDDLIIEINAIRNDWSCRDYIQNGDETGIDCGGTYCDPCVSGDEELNELNPVSLYPNPAQEVLYIDFKQLQSNYYVEVYTLTGRRVFSNNSTQQIDLSSFAKGIYTVKVMSEGSVFRDSFVKW